MTNKKFKVAAMSMALTACVAAQPLIANAADDVNAVSNEPTDNAPQSEEGKHGFCTRCCCQCVVRSGDQPAERGRCGCDRRPGYQRGL